MARGFLSFSIEKRKAVSSKGGKMAHLKGTAHEWTSEEARLAGAIGGKKNKGRREIFD